MRIHSKGGQMQIKQKKCMHNEGPHMESTCLASVKIHSLKTFSTSKAKHSSTKYTILMQSIQSLVANHTPCCSGALLLLGVLHHAQFSNQHVQFGLLVTWYCALYFKEFFRVHVLGSTNVPCEKSCSRSRQAPHRPLPLCTHHPQTV